MPVKILTKRGLALTLMLMILLLLVVACGTDKVTPIVSSERQQAQNQTETIVALTNAPPTSGPSPTATITATPYQTVTPYPDADPDMIVATIRNREITLAEFQARIRYERWLPFYALARNIPDANFDLLDLNLPQNSDTLALLYTVNGDPNSFAGQVMNAYLTEQIVLEEASTLDLEVEQTIFDGRLAARIDVVLGTGGARPPEWGAAYDKFIADMQLYTGMTETQLLEHVRALAYYQQLREMIGAQAVLPGDEIISRATVQDIILDTRSDAVDVIERLEDGEQLFALATEYGKVPTEGSNQRVIDRGMEGLPDDIKLAIFDAEQGDIVGPFPTSEGWYLARIVSFALDIPQPGDLAAIRDEYYRQWIIERLDDPDYTEEFDNWLPFVPKDPLPEDVSPLLRSENFSIPDSPFEDLNGATPTPIPLGNSPR